MKASLMGGYGPIAGYSRNSGCANECGRLFEGATLQSLACLALVLRLASALLLATPLPTVGPKCLQ